MRFVRFAVACVGAIVMTMPGLAAEDKAAEAIAAARAAIGGGRLDTLRTLAVDAKAARNIGDRQLRSTLELLVEAPDKYARIEEMTAPIARTSVMGFNGDTAIRPAGMSMGHGGAVMVVMGPGGAAPPGEKMTPEQEAELNATLLRSQRAEVSRLMLGWLAMTHPSMKATYTYAGEAESPDGKAHVIDIASDGFAARLFIDQATNLPLMMTYQGPKPRVVTMQAPGGRGAAGRHGGAPAAGGGTSFEGMRADAPEMVENRVFFSDWREAGGIQFPHVLQRAIDGETVEEWEITRVRVNEPIDPKKFG